MVATEHPPASATPWRKLPADVASALRPVLGQMAREVSAEVMASVPAFAAIGGSAKFIDELASACTDGYARQVREDAGESDRRRRHLAGLLLRGGAAWPVVAAASVAIGWPPPDQITAVILPAAQARAARFRFGADGVLAERGEEAVLLLRESPARAELAEALHGRGAVVGPTLGWAQVPTAVQLAEFTAR